MDARALLLVIDVQNDFCPGGALAVPDGDAVVPVINRLAARMAHVALTQDWHPPDHSSFASRHPGIEVSALRRHLEAGRISSQMDETQKHHAPGREPRSA